MELVALKYREKLLDRDTTLLNQLKNWVLEVDKLFFPNNPLDYICLNFESKGKILEYEVSNKRESYVIYAKSISRKLESYKKKLVILRERSDGRFEIVSFSNERNFSDDDLLISLALKEVRRRIRGETGILFNKEKENPLLYEIEKVMIKSLNGNGHSHEDFESELNSRLLDSYFLSRVLNDSLSDDLIEEIILI